MLIELLTITLRASWVHTLKEKRMIVKGLTAKLKNKFNVSIIESGLQDIHQKIELSICWLAFDAAQADAISETLLRFIEAATDAEIIDVMRETR